MSQVCKSCNKLVSSNFPLEMCTSCLTQFPDMREVLSRAGDSAKPLKSHDAGDLKSAKLAKLRMDLVPPSAITGIAKCLTFGLQKGYAEESWRQDPISSYKAALLRHLMAYLDGTDIDEESGNRHLEAVLCNASFLLELDKGDKNGK